MSLNSDDELKKVRAAINSNRLRGRTSAENIGALWSRSLM
jgi:hypothetical protein